MLLAEKDGAVSVTMLKGSLTKGLSTMGTCVVNTLLISFTLLWMAFSELPLTLLCSQWEEGRCHIVCMKSHMV